MKIYRDVPQGRPDIFPHYFIDALLTLLLQEKAEIQGSKNRAIFSPRVSPAGTEHLWCPA